jgi:long-chain fatty acid transport protein
MTTSPYPPCRTALLGCLLAGGMAAEAQASGFAIREQSASFQGLSFAGVAAGGHDISTMYFNPATLGLHDDHQAHLSLSFIVPKARFRDGSGTDPAGAPLTGPLGGNIADEAFVPAAYTMLALGDFRFGLGVTAPFGLKTEQPNDWIGRYHATESELVTVNINPTVAYRVTPRVMLGAGFVAQYADATLANIARLPAALGGFDVDAEVTGDDWDFGYTLGLLVEPLDGTRIGIGYRSQINHTITGERRLSTLGGTTIGRTGGRASVQTPQILSVGVSQDIDREWTVLGTFEWTGWSTFDDLVISFDDGSPDNVTEQNWRDTFFVALGAEYRPTPELRLQAGVAYDRTPNRDAFRTPRIPDADRTWISLGFDWQPNDWLSVGGGYSHIFVKDGRINLDDPQRGSLRGYFDNSVDILSVQGTLRF